MTKVLVALLVFLGISSVGAELKDLKKGAIKSVSRKSRVKHNGNRHHHTHTKSLVVDDAASTGSSGGTEIAPSNSTIDTSDPSTEEPAMDGAQLLWQATEWSECSVECGSGTQTRIVTCFNNDTQTAVPEDDCLQDMFVIPTERPEDQQPCEGECVNCKEQDPLFRSIGLSAPPLQPVPSIKGRICAVNDPKYSCCDSHVEDSIVTQVYAIHKGFSDLPAMAADRELKALEFITNSTNEFIARKEETQTTLEMVDLVLSQPPAALKGGPVIDKKVSRSLGTIKQILTQRLLDLDMAIDNSTAIVANIQSQLNVLKLDTSLRDQDIAGATTGTTTTPEPGQARKPKATKLSDCADASIELFASMSCAACNPSFLGDFVDQNQLYTAISRLDVSTSICTRLFKKCSPTIRDARRYLRQAMSVMRKIQWNLARTAARTQPVLLTLWSSLTFDWLPGSARPLASYQSTEDTFAPDITSLDCITNARFSIPPVTKVDDFCNAFFGEWNYHATINGIMKDIDSGIVSYQSLGRCDLCIHTVLKKLAEIFSNNQGSIDVSLALNADALAQAGCVGLSSTPAKKVASIPASGSGIPPGLNFFAMQPGELWSSPDALSEIGRKSIRAISMIMSASKLVVGGGRSKLKDDDTPLSQSSEIPLFIPALKFSDSGIDPLVLANVSWETISNVTHSPPPSMWAMRYSSEVGIVASSMNCTSHGSCNPDSGDSPYWFCANAKVCNGTIPCDETESQMLEVNPRCVKGLCVQDETAVDGKCPDVATCPVTATNGGQFDHTYLAKFKSIAPMPAPGADLVAKEGLAGAVAVSVAMNYATGVCDCAFVKETNSRGGVDLIIGDRCKYAQCLAYAQSVESSLTCSAGLAKTCSDFKEECPNLECDPKKALWEIPSCTVTNPVDGSGFLSASESKSSGVFSASLAVMIATVLLITL